MSLIGSLEDLGLGDILQIVSLSRKSGLLLLRSEEGDGRILFCDGLIRAAFVKGEAEDLRTLLVSGNFVDAETFDRAEANAVAHGDPIEVVLSQTERFPKERLDSLKREQVERSVFRMFAWKVGEFSFEIRDEIEPRDRALILSAGINAQYLTMEATRLGDEFEKDGGEVDIQFGTVDEVPAGEMGLDAISAPDASIEEIAFADSTDGEIANFDSAQEDIVGQMAVDDVALGDSELPEEHLASKSRGDAERLESDDAEPEMQIALDALAAAEHIALAAVERVEAAEQAPMFGPVSNTIPERSAPADLSPAPARPANRPALVIIDPDLAALEWQKSVLGPIWQQIHIFQRAENGIARIRQYLRRGEAPCVLVSNDVPGDRLSGIDGSLDLAERLRAHAPRMPIYLVQSGEGEAEARTGDSFETLRRPANHQIANRRSWERLETAGAELREVLGRYSGVPSPGSSASSAVATEAPPDRFSAAGLRRLKLMSDRLRDPSVRGEVLSLILEFAAESFSRVAIFMVRDDEAVGMAQSGLERAGGPGNDAFREIVIPVRDPSWFRNVLDRREGLKAAPSDDGDRELAALLGGSIPHQAYVAPIESSHQVVALVYVDNLPDDTPIAETASLEIFLHEAGLSLERALLERALADVSERGST